MWKTEESKLPFSSNIFSLNCLEVMIKINKQKVKHDKMKCGSSSGGVAHLPHFDPRLYKFGFSQLHQLNPSLIGVILRCLDMTWSNVLGLKQPQKPLKSGREVSTTLFFLSAD